MTRFLALLIGVLTLAACETSGAYSGASGSAYGSASYEAGGY